MSSRIDSKGVSGAGLGLSESRLPSSHTKQAWASNSVQSTNRVMPNHNVRRVVVMHAVETDARDSAQGSAECQGKGLSSAVHMSTIMVYEDTQRPVTRTSLERTVIRHDVFHDEALFFIPTAPSDLAQDSEFIHMDFIDTLAAQTSNAYLDRLAAQACSLALD
jgi:hypothetical protein